MEQASPGWPALRRAMTPEWKRGRALRVVASLAEDWFGAAATASGAFDPPPQMRGRGTIRRSDSVGGWWRGMLRTPTLTLKRARRLRRTMTLPEVLLWQELRGKKLQGLWFRRQHPIGPYILDFYCAQVRLAVEIDGGAHEARTAHDARRDEWLFRRGMRVLRIPAMDVLKRDNMDSVLRRIALEASPSPAFGGPPPPP